MDTSETDSQINPFGTITLEESKEGEEGTPPTPNSGNRAIKKAKRKTVTFNPKALRNLTEQFDKNELHELGGFATDGKINSLKEEKDEEEEEEEGEVGEPVNSAGSENLQNNQPKNKKEGEENGDDGEGPGENHEQIPQNEGNVATDSWNAREGELEPLNGYPSYESIVENPKRTQQGDDHLREVHENTLDLCLNSQHPVDFHSLWHLMNNLPPDSTSMDMFGINENTMKEIEESAVEDPAHLAVVMGFAGCGMSAYRLTYLLWHLILTNKTQGLTLSQVQATITEALNCTRKDANESLHHAQEDYKKLESSYRDTIVKMYDQQLQDKDKYIHQLTSSLEELRENSQLKSKEIKELKAKVKSLEKTLQGHLAELQPRLLPNSTTRRSQAMRPTYTSGHDQHPNTVGYHVDQGRSGDPSGTEDVNSMTQRRLKLAAISSMVKNHGGK